MAQMALLITLLEIFVILGILGLLSYKKVAYPASAIAMIVFTCSIFLFYIFFIRTGIFDTLVDILGNYGYIYFLVSFRVALASLISFIYFKDDYRSISLTIFLTTVIAIYTREWGWTK